MDDYYRFRFKRLFRPRELRLEGLGFFLVAGAIALLILLPPLTDVRGFNNDQSEFLLLSVVALGFLTLIAEDAPRFARVSIAVQLLLLFAFTAVMLLSTIAMSLVDTGDIVFMLLQLLYFATAFALLFRQAAPAD